jgi:hypothetical protein
VYVLAVNYAGAPNLLQDRGQAAEAHPKQQQPKNADTTPLLVLLLSLLLLLPPCPFNLLLTLFFHPQHPTSHTPTHTTRLLSP